MLAKVRGRFIIVASPVQVRGRPPTKYSGVFQWLIVLGQATNDVGTNLY